MDYIFIHTSHAPQITVRRLPTFAASPITCTCFPLAKAGAGDVLAGLIGGLWAQLGSAEGFSKHTAFKAAACGVYLHGLAGDLAAQEKGNFSVLARDVIAYLPRAFAVAEGK